MNGSIPSHITSDTQRLFLVKNQHFAKGVVKGVLGDNARIIFNISAQSMLCHSGYSLEALEVFIMSTNNIHFY